MNEANDIGHLVDLCKTVAENALYTSQAHFEEAAQSSFRKKAIFVTCAGVVAISGALTSFGLPGWIGAFGAVAGLITGVAPFLGIDEEAIHHVYAANSLTALRHEANALHETFSRELPHDQFFFEVRRLQDRYSLTIGMCDPPSNESFDKARKRIKSGLFEPDFKMDDKGNNS